MGRDDKRRLLLETLPKNAVGAEIGVFQGAFAPTILSICKPQKLFLIDPWLFQEDRGLPTFGGPLLHMPQVTQQGTPQEFHDRMFLSVKTRFERHANVQVIRQTSRDFFANCISENQSLDWVYIDGDHSYTAVLDDLENAWAVVRPGGFITGDDLGLRNKEQEEPRQPVKAAIMDFLERKPKATESYYTFGGQWGFKRVD